MTEGCYRFLFIG